MTSPIRGVPVWSVCTSLVRVYQHTLQKWLTERITYPVRSIAVEVRYKFSTEGRLSSFGKRD